MPELSEWLQIMLGEIARKRDESERAREEQAQREREAERGAAAERVMEPRAAPRTHGKRLSQR